MGCFDCRFLLFIVGCFDVLLGYGYLRYVCVALRMCLVMLDVLDDCYLGVIGLFMVLGVVCIAIVM